MRRAALSLALASLAACAPSVQLVPFVQPTPEPRPPTQQVRVYESTRPSCPFVEVAHITATRGRFGSASAVLPALLAAARTAGADAIIGFTLDREARSTLASANTSPYGGSTSSTRIRRSSVLSGTAIRFSNPDCTQ